MCVAGVFFFLLSFKHPLKVIREMLNIRECLNSLLVFFPPFI